MSLSLLVALALAAQTHDVAVIETRRSGVSKKESAALVQLVADELVKGGVRAAVVEAASNCQGKRQCLSAVGQKLGVAVLVTVETASVLDEVTVRVESISVDEDGKRLGVFDYTGDLTKKGVIAPKIAALIPLMERVVTVKKVEPVAVKPVETVVIKPADSIAVKPAEPIVVKQVDPSSMKSADPIVIEKKGATVEKPFFNSTRTIGAIVGGLGVAALGTGFAFLGMASGKSKEIDGYCGGDAARTNCTPDAITKYAEAQSQQTIGIGLAAGGGAALVTGALLLLLGGDSESTPVPVALSASANRVDVSVQFALP
jgi:hypothetical protein